MRRGGWRDGGRPHLSGEGLALAAVLAASITGVAWTAGRSETGMEAIPTTAAGQAHLGGTLAAPPGGAKAQRATAARYPTTTVTAVGPAQEAGRPVWEVHLADSVGRVQKVDIDAGHPMLRPPSGREPH
ncbi:hypothetical protein DMH15_14625 [Streptomyces sp. WAC 06725]|uniref:PepSY domain-containing protein n=1 Tax=Streptomyces sp. WAC 06725 TaxID=2203209 RepID=UPI000F74968D|nr:hypothetical protein [Streptomyces sp. WAC 06725]RSO40593.1 hypothetical protein DMH15_14625 [Streptomyces sp. WAC 06725]